MNEEEFKKIWQELINRYGNVWVHNKNGDFHIKANGYEIKESLKEVYLYLNSELIASVKLRSIDWLG